MTETGEEQQVFHPDSIPRRDSANTQPRKVMKWCFWIFGMVVAVIVCLSLLLTINMARLGLQFFLHPTNAFARTQSHSDPFDSSIVRPLIDSNSTFDLMTTVWLDVTDFLDNGGTLPDLNGAQIPISEYQLEYEGLSIARKEAILYSGRLFTDLSFLSKKHATVPLHIPISPLYGASLGPSSLRATFSVVPQRKDLGAPKFADTIYSHKAYALPRVPGYTNMSDEQVVDLEGALSRTAVSTSLISLLESPWSRPNLTEDGIKNPSLGNVNVNHLHNMFFDALPSNMHFLKQARGHNDQVEYLDELGTILLPHIATRSRVAIVKEDNLFDLRVFLHRFASARNHVRPFRDFLSPIFGLSLIRIDVTHLIAASVYCLVFTKLECDL